MEAYDPSTAVLDWDRAKRRRPNQKQRKVYKSRLTTSEAMQDYLSDDELSSVEEGEESLFKSEEDLIL